MDLNWIDFFHSKEFNEALCFIGVSETSISNCSCTALTWQIAMPLRMVKLDTSSDHPVTLTTLCSARFKIKKNRRHYFCTNPHAYKETSSIQFEVYIFIHTRIYICLKKKIRINFHYTSTSKKLLGWAWHSMFNNCRINSSTYWRASSVDKSLGWTCIWTYIQNKKN